MAQYDIVLPQVNASNDFEEKTVNLTQGGVLTTVTGTGRAPRWLQGTTNGHVLQVNASGDLVFGTVPGGAHDQNTDTGTTNIDFTIDSDGFNVAVKAESATKIGMRNGADSAYVDFQAAAVTASSIALTTGTISGAPSGSTDIANKSYVDGILGANDAMVYKGATDCSLSPNYPAADAGHTYKVSVAGKIGGASGESVEVGDMFICLTDSTASGDQATVGANWNIIQSNLDGAVIGPTSATDNAIARYDATTGKLIQNSSITIDDSGSINIPTGQAYKINGVALAATDVGAEPTLTKGNLTESTSSVLTILGGTGAVIGSGASIQVKQATSSVDGYLSSTDWTTFNNKMGGFVSAPATATSTGTAGQVAYDGQYYYVCVSANVWRRTLVAAW